MPDVTERLVAALDADARRHLLVLLTAGEADLQDTQSRGVAVVTRDLAMPGHEAGRYLDLTCQDVAGHEAFDLLGGELAGRLATGRETGSEVVARVLAKWRRFWGQVPQQMLSREAQVGLFAEIWFLSMWLATRVGAGEAVARWRGPFGARHDFESAGKSIEVKATTSMRGRIHRINGLDQLAPPEQGELLFFSLQVREEAGATNSLPKIIASFRGQLAPDVDALGYFENALVQAGYSPAHEDEYAKLRLRVGEEGLFRVDEDFPRLTAASFPSGVPSGVERVDYEVNLNGCGHLLVAGNPAAMPNQ